MDGKDGRRIGGFGESPEGARFRASAFRALDVGMRYG